MSTRAYVSGVPLIQGGGNPQQQQAQPRSVQDWLLSRREGGRAFDPQLQGTAHWVTSNAMPKPPSSAYSAHGDMQLAAGAKLITKGYPASYTGGKPPSLCGQAQAPSIFSSKGATPAFSFSERFAASAPSSPSPRSSTHFEVPVHPPPARLNASMRSLRNDADRLSAFADARDAASSLSASTPASSTPTNSRGGAQKQVLRTGHGKTSAKGDLLDIGYVGYFTGGDPSHRFDSAPHFRFEVGAGNVIPGWEQLVPGMKEGEVARLIIPSHLAYGPRGAPPLIPPNADLTFDVELNAIVQPGNAGSQQQQQQQQQQQPPMRSTGAVPSSNDHFTPEPTFAGTREGHVYKNGPLGLGYYRDPNVSAMDGSSPASGLQSARAAAPSTASVRAPGTAGGVTKSVRFDPGVPPATAHTDPRKNYRFLEEGRQRMQQAHMMESLRLPTRVVQPAAYIFAGQGNAPAAGFIRM